MVDKKSKKSFIGFLEESAKATHAKEESKKSYRKACTKVTAQELDYQKTAVLSDN